jgi:hypothetical protein
MSGAAGTGHAGGSLDERVIDVSQQTSSREELARPQWHDVLESLTKEYQGWDVTIEVVSREYGDQFPAERLPFSYIEYDPKDDVVIVSVGGRDGRYPVALNHMIQHPQRIFVTTAVLDSPLAVAVIGEDGDETIVKFYRRPPLPPAE